MKTTMQRPIRLRTWLLCACLLPWLVACLRINVHGAPDPRVLERLPEKMAEAVRAALPPLRIATYNTSLYSEEAGGLADRLRTGDAGARKIAAVLQRVRPDIVLLNEFDYDPEGRAADLFQGDYLAVGQAGGQPLHYPFRYFAPVNTGVQSGHDLDRDGSIGGKGRARGNDAWGYGLHPGQYGLLVLSRYPLDIDNIRTFRNFKWSSMPGARAPRVPGSDAPWYPAATWRAMPLSSKSHWDVPVLTPQGPLHFLVSHPTPPTFDGAEDRNGLRNADEIRLWAEYISGKPVPWLCDDGGHCGGLPPDAAFVLAGDLNADPVNGDSHPGAIAQLLASPRLAAYPTPRSPGASERARTYGLPRKGETAVHTGDFGPKAGTMRIDYVLPSRQWRVLDSGVFWPPARTAEAAFADGSDHHLVWVDLVARP